MLKLHLLLIYLVQTARVVCDLPSIGPGSEAVYLQMHINTNSIHRKSPNFYVCMPLIHPRSRSHLQTQPPLPFLHPYPILHHGGHGVERARGSTQARERHNNAVPRMILWCVFLQERKRRHDPADVAEADHPGATDAPLHVTIKVHDVPTYDNGTGGKRAHGNEADAGVFGVKVVMRGYENSEASDCERGSERDEGVAQAEAIRKIGHYETESKSGSGRRDSMELSLDRAIAECFNNCWGEVCECWLVSVCQSWYKKDDVQ